MNCANHPDRERAAFCQNCGKPLCTECIRNVGSSIFCEPCLRARDCGCGAAGGYGYGGGSAGCRRLDVRRESRTRGSPRCWGSFPAWARCTTSSMPRGSCT